jgi:hypothetical protein
MKIKDRHPTKGSKLCASQPPLMNNGNSLLRGEKKLIKFHNEVKPKAGFPEFV